MTSNQSLTRLPMAEAFSRARNAPTETGMPLRSSRSRARSLAQLAAGAATPSGHHLPNNALHARPARRARLPPTATARPAWLACAALRLPMLGYFTQTQNPKSPRRGGSPGGCLQHPPGSARAYLSLSTSRDRCARNLTRSPWRGLRPRLRP